MNLRAFISLWMAILLLIIAGFSFAEQNNRILLLQVKGGIGPAAQDYIERGIATAKERKSDFIILQLNTPGGLEKSMRNIVSDILNSSIPIVTYVAPSGARAASAGTYILYASHVAAMAPGTNLGAATPVNLISNEKIKANQDQDASEKKAIEDATAFIRSLAELRQRNVAWAEQAVQQGASISANEALKNHVIEIVATDIPDLITQLNGKKITAQKEERSLNTSHESVENYVPDWRSNFLNIITDPNIAYLLLMIGIWGLFFEFINPGFVLPGVMGAIALLLALYSFQLLPVNYAGLALVGLGVAFLIAEAFIASFGVLGVGGIIALGFGSILLFDRATPEFQIAWQLILGVCLATAAFFILLINIAIKSRLRPVVTGLEELIGQEGLVEKSYGVPRMRILGVLWQIESEEALVEGMRVKVVGVQGLILKVEPVTPT